MIDLRCGCGRWLVGCWLVGLLFVSSEANAENWTRFRGPNGSGLSEATTVPVKWDGDDIRWTVELPGIGHSSAVVWEKRLFVTSADAEAGKRYLIGLNAKTGERNWIKEFDFAKHKKHNNNSFASNTPAVDGDAVYVLWQSPEGSSLKAFTHEGDEVWTADLGPYRHGQGGATSPIVFEDLVVVSNDHGKGSFLGGYDKKTGKERWRIPREGKRACYSTPCVYQPEGQAAELIFTHCFEGVTGVDPHSGKKLWMMDVFGRFPQRAVVSPFVVGDLVITGSGARGGERNIVAIRPPASPEAKPQEAYRISKAGTPHVPTPIAYQDWLFLWGDNGIVSCVKADTGKPVWQKRLGGNYFSSPICINGKLYGVDLEGTVVVLDASDKFAELARNPLGRPTRATPAVANGVLYVRSESHVFAIGGK